MNIGDKWHEWTVAELLGTGNYGKVYRIERQEFGYTYLSALKELHIPQHPSDLAAIRNEGLDDVSMGAYYQEMIENMLSEMALMSQLKGNSNIVSYEDHEVIKDPDSIGWTVYIRMELLTPLYEYLQSHAMTVREVIEMGIDLCRALELCEKEHIIHRDIKPENIFYSRQGTFKLGDFGIARELEKTMGGLTRTGTPSYMAPEVFKGKAYSNSVDLYSLGIVLYRFLNHNRTPLLPEYPKPIRYVDRQEANMQRLEGAVLPPPCNAHGRLAEIILKACAYQPNDRYETAEELRRDLEEVLDEQEERIAVTPERRTEAFDSAAATRTEELEGTAVTVLMGEEEDFVPEAKPRRSKLLAALAVVILLLACLIPAYRYYHHTVPPVRELTAAEAERTIADAGLQYEVEKKVYSGNVKKGSVISQSPSGGEIVKKGTVVKVVLSKGPKEEAEPEEADLPQESASSGSTGQPSKGNSSKKKKKASSSEEAQTDETEDYGETDPSEGTEGETVTEGDNAGENTGSGESGGSGSESGGSGESGGSESAGGGSSSDSAPANSGAVQE